MADRRLLTRRRALALAGASTAEAWLIRPELDLTPFEYDESVPAETWPMRDRGPGRTGYAPDATPPTESPRVRWRSDPDYFRGRVESLAVGADRVYVRGGNRLVALDAADGRRQWELVVEGPSHPAIRGGIDSGPVVGRDRVYVGTTRGTISVDAPTGDADWRQDPFPKGSPLLAGSDLYYATHEGLTALDATTGAVRWQRSPLDGSLAQVLALHRRTLVAAVELEEETVIAGFDARDGRRRWTRSIGEGPFGWPSTARLDGAVAVSAVPVRAVDVEDGSVLWTATDLSDGSLATDGERIYVARGGGVVALDASDGERRWRGYAGGNTGERLPVVTDEALYVVASDAAVVGLDPATGDDLFEYRPGDDARVTDLAATGETLWVARENGSVLALEP